MSGERSFSIAALETGDVNADGTVDIADALIVAGILAGGAEDISFAWAATLDGAKFTSADFVYILEKVAVLR